jgi:hypothetical protein
MGRLDCNCPHRGVWQLDGAARASNQLLFALKQRGKDRARRATPW